jgi:protein involved in polysaccharide export with SLBB domain
MKALLWLGIVFALGQAQDASYSGGFMPRPPTQDPGLVTQNEGILPDRTLSDEEYVIGPGDLFNISLGTRPGFRVDPQGTLTLPGVTPIKVSGMTLGAAKKSIKRILSRTYDTSKVYISLAGPNTFRVNLQGEVASPGNRAVNSFARVSEIIQGAGGFTRYARRDTILIHGIDGEVRLANLQSSFQNNIPEENLLLHFGDRVVVRRVDFSRPYCIVKFEGKTFYHQLGPQSRLSSIQAELTNYARGSDFYVTQITRPGGKPFRVPADGAFDHIPRPGDTVQFVQENQDVFVGGAVARPGSFAYLPNFSASDYTFLAGISSESSSDNNFVIFRDGEAISTNADESFPVRPGDKIYVKRDGVYMTRDYLSIAASLAGIIISSITLYLTATQQ